MKKEKNKKQKLKQNKTTNTNTPINLSIVVGVTSNTMSDDPFGAFDTDSDDDDSGSGGSGNSSRPKEENLTRILAQSLMQQANEKKQTTSQQQQNEATANTSNSTVAVTSDYNKVDLSNFQPMEPNKSWPKPLYESSQIQLVSSLEQYGGNRGYIAREDLKAGTLILVEQPIMEWSDQQIGQALTLESVQHILEHPNAISIIHAIEDFYPTKIIFDQRDFFFFTTVENYDENDKSLDQIDHMIKYLQSQQEQHNNFKNLMKQLQEIIIKKKITNRDGTILNPRDFWRILLALRYNGLESGLYCYVAMLNHQCIPNCVKFLPQNNTNNIGDEDDDDTTTMKYSEVRATRTIHAGESLTISYMPHLVSHATRRQHLWDQHRFDIDVTLHGPLQQMELISGNLPPSSKDYKDEGSITSRIERAISELESMMMLSQNSNNGNDEIWEQAKALEVSSLELITQAKHQLQNEKHLLLIPCLQLHIDACDTVLRKDSTSSQQQVSLLTHSQRCNLIGRQIVSTRQLLTLQQLLWGNDHFDLARTNLDLAQAIEELLSKAPNVLYKLEEEQTTTSNNSRQPTSAGSTKSLTTFSSWSQLEYSARKEHERIKNLYPRDAARLISETHRNK